MPLAFFPNPVDLVVVAAQIKGRVDNREENNREYRDADHPHSRLPPKIRRRGGVSVKIANSTRKKYDQRNAQARSRHMLPYLTLRIGPPSSIATVLIRIRFPVC